MKSKRMILIIFALSFIFGCGAAEKRITTAPEFPTMRPTVIAVMPVMNETVDLDAPKPFLKEVRRALIARGYQVADQKRVKKKLEEEGVHVAGQVGSLAHNDLGDAFGAQALLFTTVTEWDTVFLGVYSSVTVGARFDLIDAKTSTLLWKIEEEVKEREIVTDKNDIAKAASFAITQSYEPLVKRVVNKSFATLPVGPARASKKPKKKEKPHTEKFKYEHKEEK